ncbi:MAG: serine protease, partial [Deltaproteobacteria bacterium]|nr:serine protease [Deltaproteobacteria bacterium]
MKRGCRSIIFALLMGISLPAFADQDPNEILKAIVKIRSTIPDDARSARTLGTEREGTGVVIDSQGHILTIGYLIMEAETIEVFGPDGNPIKASSVGYDYNTGFGLLRTDKPLSVAPIELGQSSEVKEGDRVLVASHGGLDSVQGAWVVFRKEFAAYWEYLLEDAIFTVPVHPNFGGAALIDRNRRLVGIGSLFAQVMVPGIGSIPGNMFVPIDHLKPILADLISKGRPQVPPRPWLGLYVEETQERIIVSR